MKNKKPLLSICIPTYNRADILDKSIASIITQPEFDSDDVELVVSDNASNDSTEEVISGYQKKHKNIYYSKNHENIHDRNFPTVMEKAHGIFRKLCNDTLIFKKGSIKKLIEIVKINVDEKPLLFFLNGSIKRSKKDSCVVNNLDAFVRIVSFNSTWIGGFGVWEDDYNSIKDKFSGCELSLWQTKVFLEISLHKDKYLIYNTKLFDSINPEKKNLNYGLYKVFYDNYLVIYGKYLVSHDLSEKTFYFLRKDLLFGFFLPWIINAKYDTKRYVLSENENLCQLVMSAYKNEKYFVFFRAKFLLLSIKRCVEKAMLGG
jgi:glycosyltransferase involved in cell wall biosynthesis